MKFIIDIVKGMLVGVSNIIPGVSGGTMMVTMGIYEKLLSAINTLFKEFKKSVLTLLPVLIGMVLGIAVFSYIIPFCLDEYPFPTCFCFIGLILGGVPAIIIPAKKSFQDAAKKINWAHVLAFVLLFAVAIVMAVLNEEETNAQNFNITPLFVILLFIIGIIASATMVIPGISGSLVLMLLGFYSGIVGSIRDLIEGLKAMDISVMLHNVGILLPFGLGVLFGIFAVSKMITWLFEKHPTITYSGILGLICASPIAIIIKMGHNNINVVTIILGIILMAAGAYFTYWFGKKSETAK